MSPFAGSHAKDGRAIELRVNPELGHLFAIPDVINKYSGLAFRE